MYQFKVLIPVMVIFCSILTLLEIELLTVSDLFYPAKQPAAVRKQGLVAEVQCFVT